MKMESPFEKTRGRPKAKFKVPGQKEKAPKSGPLDESVNKQLVDLDSSMEIYKTDATQAPKQVPALRQVQRGPSRLNNKLSRAREPQKRPPSQISAFGERGQEENHSKQKRPSEEAYLGRDFSDGPSTLRNLSSERGKQRENVGRRAMLRNNKFSTIKFDGALDDQELDSARKDSPLKSGSRGGTDTLRAHSTKRHVTQLLTAQKKNTLLAGEQLAPGEKLLKKNPFNNMPGVSGGVLGVLGDQLASDQKRGSILLMRDKVKKKTNRAFKWIKTKIKTFFESNFITYTYSLIIIVSIFGDDIRRVAFMKEYDYFMDYPLLVIMSIFIVEILYNCILRKLAYILSFELILDLFATLSILFDITLFFEVYMAPYEKYSLLTQWHE